MRTALPCGCLTTPRAPLCPDHLTTATTDARRLLYDYVDLAQLLPVGRNPSEVPTTGRAVDSPALISTSVDALQRQIWWITTTWAEVLADLDHLTPPPRRVRDGWAVQWATSVITPRVQQLAALPPCPVVDYPTPDDPDPYTGDVDGLTAVGHLSALRQRSRSTLGRTRRRWWIPGDCPACPGRHSDPDPGPLWRAEPAAPGDPLTVHCARCDHRWPWADYETYTLTLTWPTR